jgi:hypothetical protein
MPIQVAETPLIHEPVICRFHGMRPTRGCRKRVQTASAWEFVLQIFLVVNVVKNGSVRSITYASSLMTMQAALSSVNCLLNAKPSLPKKSMDRFKSRTARLFYSPGLLEFTIEHPANAVSILKHVELRAPKRIIATAK